jgi:ketosteroid isomerase-like protein
LNRQQYQEYVDHFNNKRYDKVTSYFTPDVTVEYYDDATYRAPARTLYGRKGFTDSYMALHEHTREILELGDFLSEGDLVFAELYTEFHTFRDPPASQNRMWKKGDVNISTNWVLYTMENRKMKRIRIAHFRMHDPKTAKFTANY